MKDWTERITELSNLVDGRATGHFSAMQQLVAEVQAEERTYAELARKALEDIASVDPVDAALDPQRAARIAREALGTCPEISTVQESINAESQKYVDAGKPPVHAIGTLTDAEKLRNVWRAYDHETALDAMVDRFLSWSLPITAMPDACALDRAYPHRCGTHLLTADEARQMLEHVLAGTVLSQCQVQESDLWEQIVFPPVWGPAEAAAMWGTEELDAEDVSYALNRYIDTVKLLDAAARKRLGLPPLDREYAQGQVKP